MSKHDPQSKLTDADNLFRPWTWLCQETAWDFLEQGIPPCGIAYLLCRDVDDVRRKLKEMHRELGLAYPSVVWKWWAVRNIQSPVPEGFFITEAGAQAWIDENVAHIKERFKPVHLRDWEGEK